MVDFADTYEAVYYFICLVLVPLMLRIIVVLMYYTKVKRRTVKYKVVDCKKTVV